MDRRELLRGGLGVAGGLVLGGPLPAAWLIAGGRPAVVQNLTVT
jgi:hypothetical protein